MSATGDGLSAEARERLGFPPERHVDVEAQLAELRTSRAGRGVDGGGDVDGAIWCGGCRRDQQAADEEWQPEPHVTLFIDDMTALLNDCAQGGDIESDGRPAYVAVWAVRELLHKAFAREVEWAATSDEIVQALRENGESL